MEEVKDMREIFVCSMLLMAGIDDMKRNRISNWLPFALSRLTPVQKITLQVTMTTL